MQLEQQFLEYLEAGYGAFMSGNDDRCAELDSELEGRFRARDGDLDVRCEKLRKVRRAIAACRVHAYGRMCAAAPCVIVTSKQAAQRARHAGA